MSLAIYFVSGIKNGTFNYSPTAVSPVETSGRVLLDFFTGTKPAQTIFSSLHGKSKKLAPPPHIPLDTVF